MSMLIYKASQDFLWYKKDDVIKAEDVNEHSEDWVVGGLIELQKPQTLEELKAEQSAMIVKAALNKIDARNEKAPVEEEPIPTEFLKKLTSINGIGKSSAKDVIAVYPTEEALRQAIKDGDHLPVRNDMGDLLRKEFS